MAAQVGDKVRPAFVGKIDCVGVLVLVGDGVLVGEGEGTFRANVGSGVGALAAVQTLAPAALVCPL